MQAVPKLVHDALFLVSDFLETRRDLFSFLQSCRFLYQRGKPMLARPPVHIRTFSSYLSFLNFLTHVPGSTSFLRGLHLDIEKLSAATFIHPQLTKIVRDTLQTTLFLVRFELSAAHTWRGILPVNVSLPPTLEELILRDVDIPVFSWMTHAAASPGRLIILRAYFFHGRHRGLADSLQPLSRSATLQDVTLDGIFHSFDLTSSVILPSVRRLSFGFTHHPSTGALAKAFPNISYLQLIPRCWHPIHLIVPTYAQQNINAQEEGAWRYLKTLWGTTLSLNQMTVRALDADHLALEFLDSTPIDHARSLVKRYTPSKLTFIGTPYFLLALQREKERIRDSFGPEAQGIGSLRGIAFALSDPYVLFADQRNWIHMVSGRSRATPCTMH
jgi:hypothetical protein